MLTARIAGVAITVVIAIALVAWVIAAQNSDSDAVLNAIGAAVLVLVAVALGASILADRKHFDAAPQPAADFVSVALALVVGAALLASGITLLGIAVGIGAALVVVMRARSRPVARG